MMYLTDVEFAQLLTGVLGLVITFLVMYPLFKETTKNENK